MDDTITVYLDDGTALECEIITIFEANGRDYIALLPHDGEAIGLAPDEAILYRYSEDENEEPVLDNIIDDTEFEIAEDAFDEWLDGCEYDEYVDGGSELLS